MEPKLRLAGNCSPLCVPSCRPMERPPAWPLSAAAPGFPVAVSSLKRTGKILQENWDWDNEAVIRAQLPTAD